MSSESLELLSRMKAGDREALGELLGRHLPSLRGYVRLHGGALLRAKEASTDIVQSVCREVLEHLDRFQYPSEAGFRQWLFVTAMRKIRNRYQHWGAQRRDAWREVPDSSGSDLLQSYASFCTPSRVAIAREEIDRVERAFDRLPEDYREVIVQARLVGLSRAEIAEQLGRSEVAVRTLLSRAQARLAEILDEG